MLRTVVGSFLTLLVVSGCSDPTGRLPVSGTITFAGQKLANGVIQFESLPGVKPSCNEAGIINDGAYSIPAKTGLLPGSYRVLISASAGVPSLPADVAPGTPPPPPREIIPAKYNQQTTLTAEVVRGGSSVFDFTLDQ